MCNCELHSVRIVRYKLSIAFYKALLYIRLYFSQSRVYISQFWEKKSELQYVNLYLREKKSELKDKKLQLTFLIVYLVAETGFPTFQFSCLTLKFKVQSCFLPQFKFSNWIRISKAFSFQIVHDSDRRGGIMGAVALHIAFNHSLSWSLWTVIYGLPWDHEAGGTST